MVYNTFSLSHPEPKTLLKAFVKIDHTQFVDLFCRSSIVRQLTEDGTHHLPAYVPEKIKLCKQTTIQDLEQLTLKPKVEGRIIELNPKVNVIIGFSTLIFTSPRGVSL